MEKRKETMGPLVRSIIHNDEGPRIGEKIQRSRQKVKSKRRQYTQKRKLKKKKHTQQLRDNILILRDIKSGSQTVVQFAPIFLSDGRQVRSFPKFNRDRLYYTPAFQLPYDNNEDYNRSKLAKFNAQKFRQINKVNDEVYCVVQTGLPKFEQNQKMESIVQERSQNYCKVCKKMYKNYDHHIGQTDHVNNVNRSIFSDYIKEQCERWQKIRKTIKIQNTSQSPNIAYKSMCSIGQYSDQCDSDVSSKDILYEQIRKQYLQVKRLKNNVDSLLDVLEI